MQISLDYGKRARTARLRKIISRTIVFSLLVVWGLIVLFLYQIPSVFSLLQRN